MNRIFTSITKTFLRASVSLSIAATVAAANGQTFNYADDFSITNGNPNGAWQYGYMATLGGALTLHGQTSVYGDTIWWNSGIPVDVPGNFKNIGTVPGIGGLAPGAAAIHPGMDPAEFGVARCTPGLTGTVTITGMFGQGDFGLVDVYILKNGTPIFSAPNTVVDEEFSLTTSLVATDTFDFVVGRNNIINGDTTPVDATLVVTPVPEPASLVSLGLGMAVLARRRTKLAKKSNSE